MNTPLRVLTVCTGNVCRSPAAERLLRTSLDGLGLEIRSAGTGALVGHAIAAPMAERLRALGVDTTRFAARQLSPQMVQGADLVLALAREHRSAAVTLHPPAVRRAFTLREFARLTALVSPEDIDSAAVSGRAPDRLTALMRLAALNRGHATAPPADDDVIDPWGKDGSVYDASLSQISTAVAQILQALRTS